MEVLIFIILLLLFVSCGNIQESIINFNSDNMQKLYIKQNIEIDKKNKYIIKKNKKIYYPNHFNTHESISLADDKEKTKKIINSNNIPTPKSYLWGDLWFKNYRNNEKNNMKNVKKLKLPLVIKPVDGTYGRNVHMNVNTYDDAKIIIQKLLKDDISVLIEEQVNGDVFRVLVFNDKIISAYKKDPPYVVGTGTIPLRDLIKIKNIEKKSLNGKFVQNIDLEYIKTQNFNLKSIIPLDIKVIVSPVANVNNGADITLVDIENIHPKNIEMFKKINKICDLNYNGIDFISHGLDIPHTEHGYFIENNARAGIEGHYLLDKKFMNKFFKLIDWKKASS